MAPRRKTLIEQQSAGEYGPMNNRAFEFAIQGLSLRAKTREAARLIFVEGVTRPEAIRRSGVDSGTLSKALPRIEKNFKRLLADNKLVHKDWVVPAEVAKANDVVEANCLDTLDPPRRRKK